MCVYSVFSTFQFSAQNGKIREKILAVAVFFQKSISKTHPVTDLYAVGSIFSKPTVLSTFIFA